MPFDSGGANDVASLVRGIDTTLFGSAIVRKETLERRRVLEFSHVLHAAKSNSRGERF